MKKLCKVFKGLLHFTLTFFSRSFWSVHFLTEKFKRLYKVSLRLVHFPTELFKPKNLNDFVRCLWGTCKLFSRQKLNFQSGSSFFRAQNWNVFIQVLLYTCTLNQKFYSLRHVQIVFRAKNRHIKQVSNCEIAFRARVYKRAFWSLNYQNEKFYKCWKVVWV